MHSRFEVKIITVPTACLIAVLVRKERLHQMSITENYFAQVCCVNTLSRKSEPPQARFKGSRTATAYRLVYRYLITHIKISYQYENN